MDKQIKFFTFKQFEPCVRYQSGMVFQNKTKGMKES